jgi:hypothetical protein
MRKHREMTGWDLVAALAGEPGISIEEEGRANRVVVKVYGNVFLVLADGEVTIKLPGKNCLSLEALRALEIEARRVPREEVQGG